MDSTSTTATEKGEDVELDDESVDENGARSNILLHLMVVGFHHKKGCQVEYCYPPLDSSRVSVEQSESSQDTNDEGDKCRKETVRLPVVWQTLPSLALPDGSHNHQDDTVLFHLPDTEDPTRSVFGVACYRQVSSNDLLVRTPDITRSTVQKSVVALIREPLYGIVESKLRIITRAYFNQRDFSQMEIVKHSYHNLNQQLKLSVLDSPQLYSNLLLHSLFAKFGVQVIVLLKLLLLERKTVFIMSPIRELTTVVLSICSLMPGLIAHGMATCALPFRVNTDGSSELVHHTKTNFTSYLESDPATQNGSKGEEEPSTDFEANRNFEVITSRDHRDYGLPLQIFKCSSYCLPYFSITYFDILTSERVRSCFAGSSNLIFKRWANDIDVFVTDNQIEIKDPSLRRILHPTVEDIRFMTFILRTITDTGTSDDDTDCPIDIFDQTLSTFDEGSDEWIRCHFKNYILHLMRCSFLDDTSREYRSFNPHFMAAWKATHNYKVWSNGPTTAACFRDIDAQHPFSSDRISNIKFKISNFFANQQESLNQTFNNASKVVLTNAKSTVNSWFTNLSTTIQPRRMLTRTAQIIGQVTTGTSGQPESVPPDEEETSV